MAPKKKAWKGIFIAYLIVYVMIWLFVMQFTRVQDMKSSAKYNTPSNAISMFETATDNMRSKPFSLGGIDVKHALKNTGILTLAYMFFVWIRMERRYAVRQDAAGKEQGSAHFYRNYKKYNKEFVSPWTREDMANGYPDNNIILADGLKLSMDSRKTQRNLNVLVVGGSGTGKTYRNVKPNISQMNCSYIVTDPSGEIMKAVGVMMMENGYNMRLFSTSDPKHTNVYNPFDYIYDENGNLDQTKVAVLVSTFIQNADEIQKKKSGGDPFWIKSCTAFMTFAVLYLAEFTNIEQRNMYSVLKLAQKGKEANEHNSSMTELDQMVYAARKQNPRAKCFNSYDTFKLAPPKTANSILISMAVDLNGFADESIRNMTTTSYLAKRNANGNIIEYIREGAKEGGKNAGKPIRDGMNLDISAVGDEKTVLFINIPQANSAYNFLVSMLYSQMFDALYTRAEKICPNTFVIKDDHDNVLSSSYKSKEEANRFINLYAKAEVRTEETDRGIRYFLYNPDATIKDTLPEKLLEEGGVGYLREVYSKAVGKALIGKYKNARCEKGGLRLPIHVRCLLDEFANIGTIPEFQEKLATMRKYEISCTIYLQSFAQLKEKYDKSWEVIVGNCDTISFLGSSELETDEYIAKLLGKTTIRTMDNSMSSGGTKGGSNSSSYKMQGRDLMDPAEIGKMDNAYCLTRIRGLNPMYLKKYDFRKHPNYYMTADAVGENMAPKKSLFDSLMYEEVKDKESNEIEVQLTTIGKILGATPKTDYERMKESLPEKREVDMEYLEDHFKCISKTTLQADRAASYSRAASMIANRNETPDGTRESLRIKSRPISRERAREDILNALRVSEEELKEKVFSVPKADYDLSGVPAPCKEIKSVSFGFSDKDELPPIDISVLNAIEKELEEDDGPADADYLLFSDSDSGS